MPWIAGATNTYSPLFQSSHIGRTVCLFSLTSANTIISQLHEDAPAPCIAKGPDESAGMKTNPDGDSRPQFRSIMGNMMGMFLRKGRKRMSPDNIDIAYTAVFYEDGAINELGIYAYLFNYSLKLDMFETRPELTGEFFVLGEKLLVLLWREKGDKKVDIPFS